MIVYGALAMSCLIAGFGFAMYEYDLRWQIVHAVHHVRPDLEPSALFARARSLWGSSVYRIYRDQYPQSYLPQRHKAVSFAALACFLGFALFFVLAIKHS
jgi:hypothetical protein